MWRIRILLPVITVLFMNAAGLYAQSTYTGGSLDGQVMQSWKDVKLKVIQTREANVWREGWRTFVCPGTTFRNPACPYIFGRHAYYLKSAITNLSREGYYTVDLYLYTSSGWKMNGRRNTYEDRRVEDRKRQQEYREAQSRKSNTRKKSQSKKQESSPCQNQSPRVKRVDILNVEHPNSGSPEMVFTIAITGSCLCGDVYIQGHQERITIESRSSDRIVIEFRKSVRTLWHIQLKGEYCGTSNVYSLEF